MLQTLLTLPPTNKVCVYLHMLCILNTGQCTGVGSWSRARHYRLLSNQACAVGGKRNNRGTRTAKQDVSGARAQTSPISQSVSQSTMRVATITLSLEHEFPHAVGPQHCQDSWYVEDALPAVQLQHDGASSSDHQSAEKCHQDGPNKFDKRPNLPPESNTISGKCSKIVDTFTFI